MNSPDLETAIRIYYENTEIGTTQICELFKVCRTTAVRYKAQVLEEMAKEGVRAFRPNNVVTRVAYRIWQLDIEDMERRLKKLRELKLGSVAS